MADDSFQDLIRRVRMGDAAAAESLHQTYGEQVMRIVRVRMTNPGLRRQMDSIDVCQSVFADFFVRMALGQLDVSQPSDLLKLLATMAKNRVVHHSNKQRAQKRDVRRTLGQQLDQMGLAGTEETPSQIVSSRELIEKVLGQMGAEQRLIAAERRDGRTWDEIGVALGRTGESVRKQFERSLNLIGKQFGIEELMS